MRNVWGLLSGIFEQTHILVVVAVAVAVAVAVVVVTLRAKLHSVL